MDGGLNRQSAGLEPCGAMMAQFRLKPERVVEALDVVRAVLINYLTALLGFQRQEELSIIGLPDT